jgi:hypothetical protein
MTAREVASVLGISDKAVYEHGGLKRSLQVQGSDCGAQTLFSQPPMRAFHGRVLRRLSRLNVH